MEMRAHAPRRGRTAIAESEERAGSRALTPSIQLDLASRLEVLQEVQARLAVMLAARGIDPDEVDNVGVAVRESVVNAIKHGNANDDRKQVHVSMALEGNQLEIVVRDEGHGFDPDSLPDPFAPENLLKPEGRGMLMMRSFMDDVDFSFPRSGGTVVRLRKRL